MSFYASWAHAGTHTLEYEATAVTRGVFGLPPAKAAAALEPELMGLSGAAELRVTAASEPPAPLPAPSGAAKKPCPSGCSGRGTCDERTGVCACDGQSSGPDCTLPRAPLSIGAANEKDAVSLRSGGPTAHKLYLPLHPPKLEPAGGVRPTSQPNALTAPPAHLIALSADESLLPRSALRLVADSASRLALTVHPPAVAAAACVRVTVSASSDGLLYGSRVVALWLTPPASSSRDAASSQPSSCVGDGAGYVPRPWETLPLTATPGGRPGGGGSVDVVVVPWTYIVVGAFGVIAVLAVVAIGLRRGSAERRAFAMHRLEYPVPAESPGSQSGCHPATGPAVELAAPSEVDTTETDPEPGHDREEHEKQPSSLRI